MADDAGLAALRLARKEEAKAFAHQDERIRELSRLLGQCTAWRDEAARRRDELDRAIARLEALCDAPADPASSSAGPVPPARPKRKRKAAKR